MGFFSKISEGLKKTRDSLKERFYDVFSGGSVDEDLFEELEEALVLADTGANTAMAICEELRKRVKKEGLLWIIVPAVLTSVGGGFAAQAVNGEVLKRIFGGFLLLLSVVQFFSEEITEFLARH